MSNVRIERGVEIKKIPVAFFAYNRPTHTARALDALLRCVHRENFEFFFFSDAARDIESGDRVMEVRRVLEIYAGLFSATVIKQPYNLGLAKSIVGGVSSLCESHGRVVVVEDDLLVSPDFLHFMESALDRYQNDIEVMQVGAYTIAPPANLDTDAFLLPVTTTWGWGTWARAWEKFSWTPEGWLDARNDPAWLSLFQIGGAGNYVSMLEDRLAGRNDSWGILWWYAVSRNCGQVVYPKRSLVWNGGFDGSGVHCGTGSALGQESAEVAERMLPDVIEFPRELCHRAADFELLGDVLRSQAGVPARVNSKMRFLLNQMRNGVKRAFS
jgi:hypothetical protein